VIIEAEILIEAARLGLGGYFRKSKNAIFPLKFTVDAKFSGAGYTGLNM
jgi:hypothetical protein